MEINRKRIWDVVFPHDHKLGHFKALDGLRGVAVLIVVLAHASNVGVYLVPQLTLWGSGKMGVYLFFVLSAYLLDRQIMLALRAGGADWKYWVHYVFRRVVRIGPLLLVALLVHLWSGSVGLDTDIENMADVRRHLLLRAGEGIFWSIPVEFKYYFLSPLMMVGTHLAFRGHFWKTVGFFGGVVVGAAWLNGVASFGELSVLRYLVVFVPGTMVAVADVLKWNWPRQESGKRAVMIVGMVSAMVLVVLLPPVSNVLFGRYLSVHSVANFPLYGLLWAVVLLGVRKGEGVLIRVLAWKPLRYVGMVSFSVYLFHSVVLEWVLRSELVGGWKMAAFLLGTLLISTVTYVLVELPLARVRLRKFHVRKRFAEALTMD